MLKPMRLSGASTSYQLLPDSWKCLVRIIVAVVLILLTLPAGADAKPGYEVHPGAIGLILPVEKRYDYVISVSANDRQRVQFVVDGSSSTTEYSTNGRVTSQRIEAAFGTLGRVDVGLHLVRYPSDPSHKGRCKGRAPVYQEGTYRGVIEFSRQGDVPKVSTRRGRAYFERRFRQVCKRQRPQSGPGGKKEPKRKVEVGFLTVDGKDENRAVLLQALNFALRRNPARSGGLLTAAAYERREGVRIARRTSVSIDHDSFAMSGRGKSPETVEVKLPEPFVGRALYSHSPGSSPRWAGDLSIDLPSIDRLPLTGPGFRATLCRGSSVASLDRCLLATPPTPSLWRWLVSPL